MSTTKLLTIASKWGEFASNATPSASKLSHNASNSPITASITKSLPLQFIPMLCIESINNPHPPSG